MATLLRADGTVEELLPVEGAHLSLDQLQKAVEGYIEVVRIQGGWIVCNEEGRLRKLPPNVAALGFVGNVVLCKDGEMS